MELSTPALTVAENVLSASFLSVRRREGTFGNVSYLKAFDSFVDFSSSCRQPFLGRRQMVLQKEDSTTLPIVEASCFKKGSLRPLCPCE